MSVFSRRLSDLSKEWKNIIKLSPRCTGGTCWFSNFANVSVACTYHLLKCHTEKFLYDQAKKSPANLWAPRCFLRLDIFDVCSLLTEYCDKFVLNMKAPKIHRDIVKLGVFSGQLFIAGALVGYYCRALVFWNLTTPKQVLKNIWWWRDVRHCGRLFYMGVQYFKDVFGPRR